MAIENRAWMERPDAFTTAIRTLIDRAHGRVVLPGGYDYDEARQVWNASADRMPAAIVRAEDVQDVILTVNVTRDAGLPLAIRSGGHSMVGHGTLDGGVVLDLSRMKGLTIDVERRVARAEAGLTWGEYAAAAQEHGLATTSGDVSTVGVGGLTLGGGIGWMVRKYGLTIDHLLSVDIVTADGRLVTASETENTDLFWAIRGGGGNFGVATAFEFRLQPAGMVIGGAVFYSGTEAVEILRKYAEFTKTAPNELTTMAMVMHAPPAPFLQPDVYGTLVVAIAACYAGDLEAGQAVVAPLRRLGTPLADVLGVMPYSGMFALTEGAGKHGTYHDIHSMYTDSIEDDLIETVVASMAQTPSPTTIFQFRHMGGKMAEVPSDATAFAHRDKLYMANILHSWSNPAESEKQYEYARAFWGKIQQYAAGVYVNFLGDEGELRLRQAYTSATFARLQAIKRRYDPTNLFQHNQNIKPSR